jgi:hypothetical protein
MTTLSDDQILYTKYKWEFLRRNRDYIEDWERLQNVLENKYDNWLPDERYTKEETMFCLEWKLGMSLNPENSYDDYSKLSYLPDKQDDMYDIDLAPGERVLAPGLDVHRLMFAWLNPSLLLGLPVRIVDGWAYEHDSDSIYQYVSDKVGDTGKLTVEIDLKFSKSRLNKEFKILLDEWKMLYEDAYRKRIYRDFCNKRDIHSFPIEENLMNEFEKIYKQNLKKRNKKYEKKYHFENFDDYLNVYDLRKEGFSWKKIASNLGLNSIQTARNHYKSACEIMDKGIEFYVKLA